MIWLAALSLTLTLSGYMNTLLTIHLPKGVEWERVCVWSYGRVDDKYNPGQYHEWYALSCWKPRFSVEDYHLRSGAIEVVVEVITPEGVVRTPITTIRPVEEE